MPLSIEHYEMDGSPTVDERSSTGGHRGVRRLVCDWADRGTLRDELLAFPGHVFPHSPVLNSRCRKASIQGFGKLQRETYDTHEIAKYEKALVTAYYETVHIGSPQADPTQGGDPKPENAISESLEPYLEYQTLDHSWFRWGSANGDALQPEEAPARGTYGEVYTYTRHNLKKIHVQTLALWGLIDYAGCTNNNPIVAKLLPLTYPTETLLYLPAHINMATDALGEPRWSVEFRLHYKKDGWNTYWRAKTQQYESIYVAGGAVLKQFPPVDFVGLFAAW